MASIFIYNYNNYYNRRVKGQNNTLSDYGEPIYIESGNALNFNPADGVSTTFTAGKLNNSYTGKVHVHHGFHEIDRSKAL